ncbi:formin-like protein 2 isoform X3 [Vigna radiata var. radiata]|uniref:Formin-like protein 2 isoform X3 n=1 Tax=Vigna radiata var. radiata TaxID=3916 RepID=A0A3Q0FHM9_VIGRR|nr:formin-like protein 2 isoform X3 [Vigna radiata var. radiata]
MNSSGGLLPPMSPTPLFPWLLNAPKPPPEAAPANPPFEGTAPANPTPENPPPVDATPANPPPMAVLVELLPANPRPKALGGEKPLPGKEWTKTQIRKITDQVFEKVQNQKESDRLSFEELYIAVLLVYNDINKYIPGPHVDPPSKARVEEVKESFRSWNFVPCSCAVVAIRPPSLPLSSVGVIDKAERCAQLRRP